MHAPIDSCLFFFFFFKQKTAYEMRISDWSSDVCSSDLFAVPVTAGYFYPHPDGPDENPGDPSGESFFRLKEYYNFDHVPVGEFDLVRGEIGRASCRERVCQYV